MAFSLNINYVQMHIVVERRSREGCGAGAVSPEYPWCLWPGTALARERNFKQLPDRGPEQGAGTPVVGEGHSQRHKDGIKAQK